MKQTNFVEVAPLWEKMFSNFADVAAAQLTKVTTSGRLVRRKQCR